MRLVALQLLFCVASAAGGLPHVERSSWEGATLFQRLPIDFTYRWDPPAKYDHEMVNAVTGGGACAGDFDGDGLTDLFLTQPFGGNRLLRNLGEFKFEDVTAAAGLEENRWGTGASFADLDNDGDLDLYVCGYDCPNRLYLNQGDGTFLEVAATAGVGYEGASVMMALADYDGDGDLDGYLVTNHIAPQQPPLWKYQTRPSDGMPILPDELKGEARVLYRPDIKQGKLIPAGEPDLLFRNDGLDSDGVPTFTNVTGPAGIADQYFGLSATWWDFNDDRKPDIYVSNDFWGPDVLYRNNGDGTFSNITEHALPHTPWFSMGSDAGDINNDGRLDFIASDMSGTTHFKRKLSMGDMQGWFLEHSRPLQYMRNALYLNTGTERFMEIGHMAGVASTDWTWSPKFADFDNDGWLDLFVSNGAERFWDDSDLLAKAGGAQRIDTPELKALWLPQPKRADPNLAFRNTGQLGFEKVSEAWGLGGELVSYGVALADYDNDGDVDLAVNNFDDAAVLYRNHSPASSRSVTIRLRGEASNRNGIGAHLIAEVGGQSITRHLTLSRGFMSANEPRAHIGIGAARAIDRLTIKWPSGRVQIVADLIAGHEHVIEEKGESPRPASKPPPVFRFSDSLIEAGAPEPRFDDFQLQPLLPYRLSQLGPGLACGDINSDGWDDLYIGRAKGNAGACFVHAGKPKPSGDADFVRLRSPTFISDTACEDLAPLFFDADADGDLDLFVTSGGVEVPAGAISLNDRLYLNTGNGKFTRAPAECLPRLGTSSGPACAADYDRDGDLDLFVGGRVVPGAYPTAPPSQLLTNDKGHFTASEIVDLGMVTAALWSDADGDGWIDLLVTREWGSVAMLRNREGKLAEPRDISASGWWNSIAGRDLDNDGDIDYVVGNVGLNTKYSASEKKPARIYYGSFDGTGNKRIIEAKVAESSILPVRGKSCSQNAIPSLRARFPTFRSFATATLEEIYSPEKLDTAVTLEATELASGILWNDGGGEMRFAALPILAQAAPVFGIGVTDIDSDGWCDIILAQNFYSPQAETGRMDGGVGLFLRGLGDGEFAPVPAHLSGIVAPQDAKGLAITDIDHDQRPDIVIAVNAGPVLTYLNQSDALQPLAVRLRGPRGNPTAVGARVSIEGGTRRQNAEVNAGGGYLSQSSATLYFAQGERVRVRWPDGTESTRIVDGNSLVIARE